MRLQRTRHDCAPPDRSKIRPKRRGRTRISALLVTMLVLLNYGSAQNFIVNGTVDNTGTIRVKNQTIVAQPTFGGELVLTGADQNLPAKQYQYVRLIGTGTKTTTGGSFSVQKNLTIAAAVSLNITKGTFITLGDTLFETGALTGAIQKSVNLTGSTTSSNFGNIGATISWSSAAPGITSVMRVSDSTQFGNGNQSIKRYYQIQPTDATATGTVTFKYGDDELNGHKESNLQLWRSLDNGQNWQRFEPIVDTLLNTITKSNVALTGRWAMADTVNAIGPLQGSAPIVPVDINLASTVDMMPVILTTLDTIKVLVTDISGLPVKNVPVTFAIIRPDSSAGGSLSAVADSTDTLGIATTVFTVGSKVGTYLVIATSPMLNDSVKVTTIAQNGAPQLLTALPMSPQSKVIYSQLDSGFTVEVFDIGGNPVDSALVTFSIDSIPSTFAQNTTLSKNTDSTDKLGRARTVLTLGSKVGTYGVKAVVTGVANSVHFYANATVGAAKLLTRGFGDNQTGIVGQSINPFEVVVLDAGDNPVPNEPVRFRISSAPGTDSGSLSGKDVNTTGLGRASTILTLGTKIGDYIVTAQNTTSDNTLTFKATAAAAPPKTVAEISGSNQILPILSTLSNDFVAAVRDTFGNPVKNVVVKFTIDSLTANGASASLTRDTMTTDVNGLATTRLKLGYRSGRYRVIASVNGVDTSFYATATAGAAAAMQTISGNSQSAKIITPLQSEFVVRLVDIGGNSVENVDVLFRVDSVPSNAVGHILSKTIAKTDANGTARTLLTLGNKVGRYTIRASSTGLADTFFTATATHGAAAAIKPSAGLNQSKRIFDTLDVPFTIQVVDIGENAVELADVQFSIVSRPLGDSLAKVTATQVGTDVSGIASTKFVLGSKVGTYAVKAMVTTPNAVEAEAVSVSTGKEKKKKSSVAQTSAALIETTFTAFAKNGFAAAMSQMLGDQQVNPTETELDTAFVVSVIDRGGNPVADDSVRFTVVSAPENATNQAVRDSIVPIDSNGIAKTFLTLGTREGVYTVQATVGNAPVTQFVAKAYLVYGDLNKDIAINIADITTLVDILNKKIQATTSDSLKADFNHDGFVDTLDIRTIRELILDRPIFTNTLLPAAFLEETNNSEYIAPPVRVHQKVSASAKTVFEATPFGLRVNLNNDEPVRGIELRIRLKDSSLVLNKINMLFRRAEMMNVFVSTKDGEVRVAAYNLNNTEIMPDSSSIFRLPFITNLDMIDTSEVTIALRSNMSALVNTQKTEAPVGAYPITFRLSQNYPNPFNGSTTIEYDIPDGTEMTKTVIQVFNVLGQRVKTLLAEDQQAGRYSVRWDGTDQNGNVVSSGVYFYRLISKSHVGSRKMLYVK